MNILKLFKFCQGLILKVILCTFLTLTVNQYALADDPAPNTPSNEQGVVAGGFNRFINKVEALTSRAITEQDFVEFVDMMFLAFSVYLIVTTMYNYSLKAASLADIFSMILLISMTKMLMVNFDSLVSACWGVAVGVANSLQRGMVGNDDLFFGPRFIGSIMESVMFSGGSWTQPFRAVKAAMIVFMASGMMILLSMLSYISAIWAFWGFSLSKLIGLLFVPTLLFEKLHFLFDGWLRFMFGFVVYYIIARLNLVMVACSLALYLGVGLPPTPQSSPIEFPDVESFFEVYGLLTFTFVGILALFSTGKFAGTIVAGAGGGGMGSAILGATRAIGKIAAK